MVGHPFINSKAETTDKQSLSFELAVTVGTIFALTDSFLASFKNQNVWSDRFVAT